MLQSIIEAIKSFFGFGEQIAENKGAKIPLQEKAIREAADTRVIKHHRRQDRILDKDLKRSEKILYYFDSFDEFNKSTSMTGNERALYFGDKHSILKEIRWDIANILTRKQGKLFRRLVEEGNKPYYVIKIHPLTLHGIE